MRTVQQSCGVGASRGQLRRSPRGKSHPGSLFGPCKQGLILTGPLPSAAVPTPHKSADAVSVRVCNTLLFAPSFPHFKQSEEKELGSLTHLPSVGELTCVLQTGGVPGLLLTEK